MCHASIDNSAVSDGNESSSMPSSIKESYLKQPRFQTTKANPL